MIRSAVQNQKDNYDISWIQKETKCWVYQPQQQQNDIYLRGTIKGIIPLADKKANSKVSGILETGTPFQSRARLIEKCRASNSLERDLIQMDIINAPQVLRQLKRRLSERKIHTLIWNSLIVVNPYKQITESYSDKILQAYYEHILVRKEQMKRYEPHIYSFTMHILATLDETNKIQVVSISGQSGSGKTETNKEALRAISYCCAKVHQRDGISMSGPETKLLKCDPILESFGNAKTIKNDNSSRFGKLITLMMDGHTLKIHQCLLKNFFLEKSRIISQNLNQRNFHIFYQFLAFLPQDQKMALRLKAYGKIMQFDDFKYLTNRTTATAADDKNMWDDLNKAFISLDFSPGLMKQIWSIVAAILLMGNIQFQTANDDEPCDVRNMQVAQSVAYLLGLQTKQFLDAMTTHKRTIAGEIIRSPLTVKHCSEGKDAVAKTMYESLFIWLVRELNQRLNTSHEELSDPKIVKLLDIYGFEVLDHNSFEQLSVNYINQKIHQIYLEQIFVHQRNTFKKEGLENIIQNISFTDNTKIIDLLELNTRSVFNLLDESCSVNVTDDSFLTDIKKFHDQHQHFPDSNLVNTKKSFIIKHTPGDIEYMIEGFRQKNKDLIREDLLQRLSNIKIKFIGNVFRQKYQAIKQESNKRFLSLKIRKQVKELITEMSTNTDIHFIRCIKPNEKKAPLTFVDKVCYNQIKYLGILDTIQLRKDTYHIRSPYQQFYSKYGILQNNLDALIDISEGKVSTHDCKEITMNFINDLNVHFNLDYQFGKERIFLKMSAQNRLDSLLSKKLEMIEYASTRIKVQYIHYKMNSIRKVYRSEVPKIQRAIRSYLINARISRQKRAVRKIEDAWIMYHEQFYARKKLPSIKILQRYIKRKKDQMIEADKIKNIRKAKQLLKELARTNKLCQRVQNYREMKKMFCGELMDMFWWKLRNHYLDNMEKYFKGGAVILNNIRAVKKAEDSTYYRLNIKYRRCMEKYLKGLYWKIKYNQKMKAIVKIQSYFKMTTLRRTFLDLKEQTIKIQRNWRRYYYDKQFNIDYTEQFFQDGPAGAIDKQKEIWNSQLYRNLQGKKEGGRIEKVLSNNERVKMDKIGLFYYLLDFQILSDLSHVYPNSSWVDNYINLYEQSWQKGNPIQMIDVSDTQTMASTLNKVYTWGNIKFQDFDPESKSYESWKNVKPVTLPSAKITKIRSHENFGVVDLENEESVVIGDRKLYEEDCSAKEWKTLSESYVIINGIILYLKKAEFSRMPINEKVVQLSCGMSHSIVKTSLRKVYTWGDNSEGQLGHGHYKRVGKPRLLDYFPKHAIMIQQSAASAYGSLVLDNNNRIYWWGSNGSIKKVPSPREVYIFQKSNFLDNPQKYTIARIITSWSKSLSIIGITLANHQGIFKSSQNQIKKKTFENLISKWNQDITTVMPPYVQSISGYFQQRLMPKPKIDTHNKNLRDAEHQKIREKLLSEITLMEQAQKMLLKQRKRT